MRILVTNDDGVDAPGLRALAGALAGAGHVVVVVAPTDDRSGSGAAIGPIHRRGPVPVDSRVWDELPGVPVLAVDGPPAVAVYGGCLGAFGPPPDLVASGINPGPNTGHLVIHSGTVGAAMTAANLGCPGLAVSIAAGDDLHWATAARLAVAAAEWVAGLPGEPRVCNLNVPNRPASEVLGVRDARLAPYGTVWTIDADHRSDHLELVFRGNDVEADSGTDLALLRAGYASVTTFRGLDVDTGQSGATRIAGSLAPYG